VGSAVDEVGIVVGFGCCYCVVVCGSVLLCMVLYWNGWMFWVCIVLLERDIERRWRGIYKQVYSVYVVNMCAFI
jgi:hypothetical protein